MLIHAKDRLLKIFNHDATSGIIMLLLVIVALSCQNSDYAVNYRAWLNTRAGFSYGSFELMKPLLLWINDGLISLFFFSIGLELKHEFMEGHMSKPRNIVLPALGAVGGILVPAFIFFLCNMGDPYAMRGWAIPTATDTAFSLTLVLMLGKRVPSSLKVFLLSLAIFDDVGAILVIALFYTSELSVYAFSSAGFAILVLLTMNLLGVTKKLFYCVFGFLLWLSILQSGVHATLAGIITAFFIPLKKRDGTPLVMEIYHDIKGYLSYFILPLFVFANAGIDLSGITPQAFFSGVPMGIFLGLFIGKQLGIFGVSYLCIRFKLCSMPEGATFKQLYGVCILTGIGFTMSLFIDGLAYQGSPIFSYTDSFAIIVASVLSGAAGYVYLRFFASDEKGDKIISVKKLLTRGKQDKTAKAAAPAETAEEAAATDQVPASDEAAQSESAAGEGAEAQASTDAGAEPAAQKEGEDKGEAAAQAEGPTEPATPEPQDTELAPTEDKPADAKAEASEVLPEPKEPEAVKDVKEQAGADEQAPQEPAPSDTPALEQKEPQIIEPPVIKGKSKIVIAAEPEAEPQESARAEAETAAPKEEAGSNDAPAAQPEETKEEQPATASAPQEEESTPAPQVKGKSKIVIKVEDEPEPEPVKPEPAESEPASKAEPADKELAAAAPEQEQEPEEPVIIKGKGKIEIKTAEDDDSEELPQKPEGEPALKENDAAPAEDAAPEPMPKQEAAKEQETSEQAEAAKADEAAKNPVKQEEPQSPPEEVKAEAAPAKPAPKTRSKRSKGPSKLLKKLKDKQ